MTYVSTGTAWPMAPPPAVSPSLPAAPAAASASPGIVALILAGLAVLWLFSGERK